MKVIKLFLSDMGAAVLSVLIWAAIARLIACLLRIDSDFPAYLAGMVGGVALGGILQQFFADKSDKK